MHHPPGAPHLDRRSRRHTAWQRLHQAGACNVARFAIVR
jgi:hypothetical protein